MKTCIYPSERKGFNVVSAVSFVLSICVGTKKKKKEEKREHLKDLNILKIREEIIFTL